MARRSCIGAVLAGGSGRRIGGDKATVELEGRPLVHYPLSVLRAVLDEVAIVAKQSTVLPGLDVEIPIWLEPDEPRHPLAGVVHALRCARGQPVVAVAGDMPFVTRAVVAALARERSRGAAAVVPRAGGRLQPLCARYEPRALGALAGCDLAAPVADAVVGALAPRILEWPDEEPFFTVKGPEDILHAAALLGGR
jgi:molybdopterin-guanine dinucleotide biosynthesis protein A